MKKLMFAAAAIAAGVAMADVTSANVVGYTNFKTVDEDNVMAGGSFISVSANGTYQLKDLSVSGYDLPHWDPEAGDYEGGCFNGDFTMDLLGPTGAPLATFLWMDWKEGYEEGVILDEQGPGWYESDGLTPVDLNDPKCIFNAGQAFWIRGNGLKLVSAGQVDKNVLEFKTVDVDNCGCGNGTAATVNLGAMWVTGYDLPHWDPEAGDYEGGCYNGDFTMDLLGPTGAPLATFLWMDWKEGYEEGVILDEQGPGWYESDGLTPVDYKDPKCDFLPGTGFWVRGNGLKLNIPSPIAETKDAE